MKNTIKEKMQCKDRKVKRKRRTLMVMTTMNGKPKSGYKMGILKTRKEGENDEDEKGKDEKRKEED